MPSLHTQRIYETPATDGGYRVLVDRLWPRGVRKEQAALDEWAKNLAPSTELRMWFGHKPERFKEFSARYIDELHHNPAIMDFIADIRNKSAVTLLYAAKDPLVNHAVVLKQFLEQLLQG